MAIITTPLSPEVKASKDNKVQGKWTMYQRLEDIGITQGEETIDDIVAAMPDYSILLMYVDSNNNRAQYPGQELGTLLLIRVLIGRIYLEYTPARTVLNEKYIANYYYGEFSGWKQFVDMDTFSAAIAELTTAIAALQ